MTWLSLKAKSRAVLHLRRLVHSHPFLAAMLLGLVLLMKAMLPAGYMTVAGEKTISVQLCSSSMTGSVTLTIPLDGHEQNRALAAEDQSCAFAGLGAQALAAVDPIILSAAIAFTFLFVLLVADLRLPRHGAFLQPPARGPPALI